MAKIFYEYNSLTPGKSELVETLFSDVIEVPDSPVVPEYKFVSVVDAFTTFITNYYENFGDYPLGLSELSLELRDGLLKTIGFVGDRIKSGYYNLRAHDWNIYELPTLFTYNDEGKDVHVAEYTFEYQYLEIDVHSGGITIYFKKEDEGCYYLSITPQQDPQKGLLMDYRVTNTVDGDLK